MYVTSPNSFISSTATAHRFLVLERGDGNGDIRAITVIITSHFKGSQKKEFG